MLKLQNNWKYHHHPSGHPSLFWWYGNFILFFSSIKCAIIMFHAALLKQKNFPSNRFYKLCGQVVDQLAPKMKTVPVATVWYIINLGKSISIFIYMFLMSWQSKSDIFDSALIARTHRLGLMTADFWYFKDNFLCSNDNHSKLIFFDVKCVRMKEKKVKKIQNTISNWKWENTR